MITKVVYFKMFLGNVKIEQKTVLAPLAGVSDSPFRQICRIYGAGLVFTEMVSADGLVHESEKTRQYLRFEQMERPIGVQLFGDDPEVMATATQIVAAEAPDLIDINLGCPVPKVTKRGAGAALLQNLKQIEKIVSAMVRATSIPILAKVRSGWNEDKIVAVDLARMLEQLGLAGITIHGRTQTMKFSGRADWSIIQLVKAAVKIPVIGNGDITRPEDARQMLDETGCDLVMIGRGAFGNPWIFKRINHYLTNGVILPEPTPSERLDICLGQFKMMTQSYPERSTVFEARKHIGWYTKGIPQGAQFRNKVFHLTDKIDVEQALIDYRDSLKLLEMV
ncbi:tRNA dihydrouridine synthase DusB [candidate division KSB1 bacterium]|nr:tRNA dihydrouridine synthase DusB [candidate division KSB1 bacterium]